MKPPATDKMKSMLLPQVSRAAGDFDSLELFDVMITSESRSLRWAEDKNQWLPKWENVKKSFLLEKISVVSTGDIENGTKR